MLRPGEFRKTVENFPHHGNMKTSIHMKFRLKENPKPSAIQELLLSESMMEAHIKFQNAFESASNFSSPAIFRQINPL